MAGRASVILRDQFEVAKRQHEVHGTTTAVSELRPKVTLALLIVTERLNPIDAAVARCDFVWLAGTYPDWRSARSLLQDETRELKRLLDHVDSFVNSFGE